MRHRNLAHADQRVANGDRQDQSQPSGRSLISFSFRSASIRSKLTRVELCGFRYSGRLGNRLFCYTLLFKDRFGCKSQRRYCVFYNVFDVEENFSGARSSVSRRPLFYFPLPNLREKISVYIFQREKAIRLKRAYLLSQMIYKKPSLRRFFVRFGGHRYSRLRNTRT